MKKKKILRQLKEAKTMLVTYRMGGVFCEALREGKYLSRKACRKIATNQVNERLETQ